MEFFFQFFIFSFFSFIYLLVLFVCELADLYLYSRYFVFRCNVSMEGFEQA